MSTMSWKWRERLAVSAASGCVRVLVRTLMSCPACHRVSPGPVGGLTAATWRCGFPVPPGQVTYSRLPVDHHVRNRGRAVEYRRLPAPALWTSRAAQPAHARVRAVDRASAAVGDERGEKLTPG